MNSKNQPVRRVVLIAVIATCFVQASAAAGPDEMGNARGLETPVFGSYHGPSAPPPADPNVWGTGNWNALSLPAVGFHGLRDAEYWTNETGWIYHDAGSWYWYDCAFQLPTGALVYGLTPFYYDNSDTEEFEVWIFKYNIPPGSFGTYTEIFHAASGIAATPGFESSYQALAATEEIVNWDDVGQAANYFQARIKLASPSGNQILFAGMTVWYQLQISPAPAVQTFPDVAPGYWAFQEIEALAASGITTGFPDGTFRPTTAVTRAQMATFLARALGLHWKDQ